ncbi:MAG: DUF2723 domain-containing protein [Paludibacter sp.]|nr:DUF2723 domain-containing protein [Paludibacter sp.]
MKQFKLLNNIFGWVAFVIAATTYLITMEPTASFWDCGEFISTAFKLDVGHPPGAPFFMLTGRFFSLFASDPTQVALMINTLSALASAFTILFLFWTITHLARKVVAKSEEEYTLANVIGILGSGMVGALAYTFSDTFWFSAVEGEVYAYSSLFTAVVFWAILKWENVADRPGSDRWLIFIGYLMGLSIGVHLLNLLAIPAIVLVYYFRNYKPSTKGVVLAMSTAVVILGVVLYGIIPGFVEVASWFELFFVNTLGFSFNTGLFIYILLTLAALAWGLHETYNEKNYVRMAISFIVAFTLVGIPFFGSHIVLGLIIVAGMTYFFFTKREKINARWLNTALAMITVILIGYSTYTVIVIRSAANPPMDQNSPDNVFALKYYLNREQYGDRPLFYGSVYNAPVKLRVEGNMCVPEEIKGEAQYAPKPKTSANDKDEYFVTGNKMDYKMDERFDMLFPRMYSSTPSHVEAYKIWGNVKGKSITYDYCGQQKTEVKPTFGENIQFFLDYQVRFMYLRYFMWNFSGRQNDIQGNGEIEHGNWITGFNFIDKYLVGDQTKLPSELAENKGRNTYFMLPLILGIFGILFLIYNGKEGKHTFWVTTLLFLLTGLAIVIYLNQTPYQPRERDYAYAGSFYAFSIWIGLGVLGIIKAIDKYIPKAVAASVVTILALGVPALMAAENWDDHDRSNRYVARDFGGNYLASLKPNAIVFSNGDNDTFPLWYNQEVEGQRTDVRVCNLSYLQTDWYIDQMKRGAYESAPLPISWEAKDYVTGKNEVMWVEDMIKEPIDMKTAFDFLLSDDPATKMNGESFIPSSKLFLPVDANQVIKSGTLAPERAGEIVPQIDVELKRRITKSEIMILEMLKTNNGKRPVYFAVTVGDDYYLGLNDHFELTGLAYQILPIGAKGAGSGVNTKEMYDNMINKFRYGNIQDPKVYLDENTLRMCRTHRMMFSQLASALYNEGDSVKALKTLDFAAKMIPGNTVRHDYVSTMLAETYYKLGESQKGDAIMEAVAKDCVEYLEWYYTLTVSQRNTVNNRIGHNLAVLNQILRICDQENQKNILDKYLPVYMKYTKNVEL